MPRSHLFDYFSQAATKADAFKHLPWLIAVPLQTKSSGDSTTRAGSLVDFLQGQFLLPTTEAPFSHRTSGGIANIRHLGDFFSVVER
ncbi:hypothetical protein ACN4EK_09435 [Pantanalinema rosaneae CENA516]|uniref:hypothetical protein n=1 Tax=Pantanalinema rosaneae TaxID=1620701 RepID=UPI003D6F47A3